MNRERHPDGPEMQAYYDGELDAGAAARVAAHCTDCAPCRAELAGLKRLEGLLAVDPEPVPRRPLWPGLAAARERAETGRLGPAFAFAVAAACAAGVVIGVLLGPVGSNVRSSTGGTAWTGPESLWSGGTGGSLLDVHLSDLD